MTVTVVTVIITRLNFGSANSASVAWGTVVAATNCHRQEALQLAPTECTHYPAFSQSVCAAFERQRIVIIQQSNSVTARSPASSL